MTGFDWHSGDITPATVITDSYRNTQKVRRFFRATCGDEFKFDRSFMAWMKAATGRTMADAVLEWRRGHVPAPAAGQQHRPGQPPKRVR